MTEILIDNDYLKMTVEAGDEGETVVVSFTGVQSALGGIETGEFARSLRAGGKARDVYYVIDKTRSWYNATSPDILATLGPRLAGRRAVALGNSMGGFGALLFQGLLDLRAAIAFCPQFSVHPDVAPFETRWPAYRKAITHWRHDHCFAGGHAGQCVVFFGRDSTADMEHLRAMLPFFTADTHLFLLGDGGHGVVQVLKARGILPQVLDDAIGGDGAAAAIAGRLRDAGIAFEHADGHSIGALCLP